MTTFRSRDFSIHLCNWPECRRPIGSTRWGCNYHTFVLPEEIRERLWKAGGHDKWSPEWRSANDEAQSWIKGAPARIAAMNLGRDTPVSGGKPC